MPQESELKQVTLPKQTAVGEIAAANIFLALLVPEPTGHGVGKNETTAEKGKTKSQKELLDIIDLMGLGEWSQNEQKRPGSSQQSTLVYLL